MKTRYFKKIGLQIISLIAILIFPTGCLDDFEEINKNPTQIVDLNAADFGKMYAYAQRGLWAGYQTGQSLQADLYAQYFASTSKNFGQDRYVMNNNHITAYWNRNYGEYLPNTYIIISKTEPTSPENAMCRILRAYYYNKISDYWGPVPYSSTLKNLDVYPYDSQEFIYNDMIKELTEAAEVLKNNLTAKPFAPFDAVYYGDVNKWIKFANTLKLRLAVRISDIAPSPAKTAAEAAVANGVMTDIADDAYYHPADNKTDMNGLSDISWYMEFRMSASMESYLKGFNDPRMEKFFRDPIALPGQFHGIRNGMTPAEMIIEKNSNDFNSNVNAKWHPDFKYKTPQDVIHAAEAYFLRAEGALKGWNMGGTAKELYETGIRTSMKQYGITDVSVINAYIDGTTPPVEPGDYFNSPAVATTHVKWAANDELRKEQINVQKWLALYPDGHEAWANVRRSGYPKLYPVLNNDNADLPENTPIKRVPFIIAERESNKAAVEEAEKLLGNGGDKVSTRLWWDVN